MKPSKKFTWPIATAMLGALALTAPVIQGKGLILASMSVGRESGFGQTQGRPASESDRLRTENERDLELRIWNLRALSEQPRQPEKKKPSVKQALAEMQKDFTRLQLVNKDLLRVALGNGALDPKFVLKSVTEIRERAERLNKNLALPEPDKSAEHLKPTVPAGPDHLKRSVMRLGTLIFRFVDNPFFKEISVVDTQQTTRARRDLEDIIELSAEIKKNNEPKN